MYAAPSKLHPCYCCVLLQLKGAQPAVYYAGTGGKQNLRNDFYQSSNVELRK